MASLRAGGARVLAAAVALVSVPAAFADTVHEITAGGDTVAGTIASSADLDRVPFRLVEGSTFTLSLKAAKGSALHPSLDVLGVDRLPDDAANDALVVSPKGNSVVLKNHAVTETGLRYLEIRGASGTTGGWLLSMKVKLPKGAAAAADITGGGAPVDFVFTSPGNATATITVSAAKGSAARPAFVSLKDPSGASLLVDDLAPTKTGFAARSLLLAKPGAFTLRVSSPAGATGGVTFKAKWKVPKPYKRTLADTDIVTDPVVDSISPGSGDTTQTLDVEVIVDFAQSGAVVVFHKEPTVVTILPAAITAGARTLSFDLDLASFQQGSYDVEVRNPDGGTSTLPDAVVVVNGVARPTSITPTFGYDSQTVAITVAGTYLMSTAGLTLERNAESITGTSIIGGGGSLTGQFDLTGHTPGSWDFVVTNPDAAPARLSGVFDLRKTPPSVTAITPSSNLSSTSVSCTVTGTLFEATPTVVLRRSGQSDVAATGVAFVDATRVTGTFDTSGAAPGSWDVVVTNPDALYGTLASGFHVLGAVGPSAQVLSPVSSADAPPAVCHDATRNEFLVAWVDTAGSNADVYAQRVSASGTALGNPVSVSSSSSGVSKKDVAVGWDSTNDQYLVTWSEIKALAPPNGVAPSHPSYNYNSTGVYLVFAQRLRASDLAAQGSNLQVTDHVMFGGFYMDEFNDFRSSVVWDPKNKQWQIAFLQEWSTSNISGNGFDDYDTLFRSLDPATGTLGTMSGVAYSPYHEGDPALVWDPVGQQVIVAYVARTSNAAPLNLHVAVLGAGTGPTVVSDSSDLADPAVTFDSVSKRLLLTWTRKPSGGNTTVQGCVMSQSGLTSIVGSVLTIGTGASEEHFLARPLYNSSIPCSQIAWTRIDSLGAYSVRVVRADAGASGGLALIGSEQEASAGNGDEAGVTAVLNGSAGEGALFWLKTISFTTSGSYTGSVTGGTYRGTSVRLRRYQ